MALNMNKVNEKQEELNKPYQGDFNFFTPKDGRNVIRICPPKGDKDVFWKEADTHFNVGPEGKLVICLKMFKKKCPICEEVARLKKSSNKEDQKLADKMKVNHRAYVNIIDRGDSDKIDVPQVYNCGNSVLKELINLVCDPEYGDITDFNEGFDITLTKSGKGMNTEYKVTPKRKESAATTTITEEQLQEALPDLDTLVTEKSREEIIAILNGDDIDDIDDANDDIDNNEPDDVDNNNDDDELQKKIQEALNNN